MGLFIGNLVTFIIFFGALITYLPTVMYENFWAAPLVIGLIVASSSLTTALTSTQLGRLTDRFSEEQLIRVSFILYAVSLGLVPLVPSVWVLLVPTVICGVAQSINIPNSFSLLNKAAPTENRRAFTFLNSTILRLGQTLGSVLMSAAAVPFGLGGASLPWPSSPPSCSSSPSP